MTKLYFTKFFIGCMLFFCSFLEAFAQGKVTGTVVSSSNEPLPGASIQIKGTTRGTVTDLDGYFELTGLENGDVLSISFVGFIEEEITYEGQESIDVMLIEDIAELDGVVVIGYGVQKKSDLTGSITSVSSEDLDDAAVVGVDQALQGRAAGVQITQNSGMPGDNVTINIRGMGTWGDNDPLYVVDGIPIERDISFLNPSDIQSIEILKDASAAAIYGARAANGVVLVTTKRGDQNTSVLQFDFYTGIQQPWNQIDLLNAEDYIDIYNEFRVSQGRDPENPVHWDRFFITEDPDSIGEGTNWQDAVFQNAPITKYNLLYTGGKDKSNYAISASYMNQEGIVKNSGYNRYSFRLNSDHQVLDRLKIGQSLTMSLIEMDEQARSSPLTLALRSDPVSEVYLDKDDPDFREDFQEWAEVKYSVNPNPVGVIDRTDATRKRTPLIGNIYAEYEILKGLKFKSNAGIDLLFHEYKNYIPEFYESGFVQNTVNKLTERRWKNFGWIFENTLNYSKTIKYHDFNFLLGYMLQKKTIEDILLSKSDFPLDLESYRYLSLGTKVVNSGDISGGATEASMISYLGRLNYSFAGKYLVTASLRRDGSSRFGPESKPKIGNKARFDYFPSFSLAWKVSEESFFRNNINFLNLFKIRAGWGQIGNDRLPNDYPYLSNVEFNQNLQNYVLGDQTVIGGAIVGKPNKTIRWETSQQTNIGIDLTAMQNRLSFSADWYHKKTVDQIVEMQLPLIVGVFDNPQNTSLGSNPMVNVGEVVNQGIELILGIRNKETLINYDFDFNFSMNQNEVLKLGYGNETIFRGGFRGSNISRTDVGLPIASFYGFVTDGLFTEEDDTDGDGIVDNQPTYIDDDGNTALMQPYAQPGDIKFVDQDGDGRLTSDDKKMIGSPHPDFTYGMSAQFNYKNWDLSMFWQGVQGNDIFNTMLYDFLGGDFNSNFHDDILNYYRSPVYDENDPNVIIDQGNTNTDIPRIDGTNSNGNYTNVSDIYIEDGSYLRLKNLQIGYYLPENIANYTGIKNVRIYVSGQNLITFTKYRGSDPEIGQAYNNYGMNQVEDNYNSLVMGVDYGNYPQARTYMVGVNITF